MVAFQLMSFLALFYVFFLAVLVSDLIFLAGLFGVATSTMPGPYTAFGAVPEGERNSWKLKRLQTLWFDDVDMTAITPREKGAEMSSVLRPVRKKSRKLGPVDVIRREDYGDLELDGRWS